VFDGLSEVLNGEMSMAYIDRITISDTNRNQDTSHGP
jgi:hypothetical protein